ncbi:Protein ZINC INDUCED FACILITATOR-LIKE 1 [Ananas comosus]|uniref:Protein ZINC INDUCED FACILITATOR-LIKE 1 n=1 Tax=Ananas comosus TaxID=4615 RepID=A0A199UJN9_ANACO|nr:Protein ZINC INDUCED FACILITATOR-LIKE 1 [Ananas comosus]
MDKRKESHTGIPYKEFFSSLFLLFQLYRYHPYFPSYISWYIRDLNIAEREEDIGFYAGFVVDDQEKKKNITSRLVMSSLTPCFPTFPGAAFMLGRAITSVFWGIVADRHGRKPIIVIGIFSVIVFNTLFGLSVNYWMAIITRFLLGALNGLLGPVKAYASELCRPEHQALGMSLVSTAWGIGLIVGPAIGGYFAQPAEKYPEIFSPNSVWGRFPYFLPCLCISFFAVCVFISCLWLPETLHMHHNGKGEENETIEALEAQPFVSDSKQDATESEAPKENLFKNWPLMSAIIAYCIFSLHDMAYTEIFSLWAVSGKSYGGLSFSSQDVGQVLAISGFSLLVYQLFVYPRIEKILGPIYSCRLSAVTIITGLFILQNNAVPQNQRGAANGISMTAMSLFKAVAPAGGGAIFSWAQKRQHASFLPGDQMVFFILNLFEFIGFVLTFKPFLIVPGK